jgi:hypothetical protein
VNLRWSPLRLLAEACDKHTPFVLGATTRTGSQDHQLAGSQGDASPVQETSRHHALKDARVPRNRAEKQKRRCPPHQLVEVGLHFGSVRGSTLGFDSTGSGSG